MRKTETLNLRQNSKTLRSNMTEAERVLWYHLRAKRFCGIKFYRQKIVGNYIADFLSLNPRLIIELDGSQHAEQIEYDRIRTTYLEEQQFTVIRFWNDEVLRHINMVLDVIFAAIHENIPSPSENPTDFLHPILATLAPSERLAKPTFKCKHLSRAGEGNI
ncbi:endonuclease domain-containing protein [Mannheimia sp. E30BD]|uniref:endonuclease domain-containing protein n=1 Tax=Mannheimia sp. E30BD TaxID=3278708 RepID=UPI00359D3E98